MISELPELPICDVLPDLARKLAERRSAVLVAPPGAGKTTLVPLFLLEQDWCAGGRIILLEPRRLAARAAARRMASLMNEQVGETVGYAMRMESRQSEKTRILVVTEGIFVRMLLDDPELSGISCVVFDEFHERSLDADMGLAFALDVANALRDDLRLLVMSATLDGARVASILDNAPIIESKGRAYPLEITYRPRKPGQNIEDATASAIRQTLAEHAGSLLVFLPGQREIERVADQLQTGLAPDVDLVRLFGAMDSRQQDLAIRPPGPDRRKVVLATSIAETSITIDGVRIVIDSGLARQPVFEPATGMTRLETVRVSQASANQRAGRAARTGPGMAIRLWNEAQTGALSPFSPPEILSADLSGLLMDCAVFGVTDPCSLRFLDPPPLPALNEARSLLMDLGALNKTGRLTQEGQAMRRLALPARLAHMVSVAARIGQATRAAQLAILMTERGLGGNSVDLEQRHERFLHDRTPRAKAAHRLAASLARSVNEGKMPTGLQDDEPSTGLLVAQAWPDRIARHRGGNGRFLMANGRGAVLDEADPLASSDWLVIADVSGVAQNARILSAAAIAEDEIRLHLANRIRQSRQTDFDIASGELRARTIENIGAIILSQHPVKVEADENAVNALIAAIRQHGIGLLPWTTQSEWLRYRLDWLHRGMGHPWPAMDEPTLVSRLEEWLQPFMNGLTTLAPLRGKLSDALMSVVPYELHHQLDKLAPAHFNAPSGSRIPIRYEENGPVLAIRVQELFGLKVHPSIANGSVPLLLELLSPAQRPIQTTRDLPGFWQGSWRDVRADMRGRYPKHVWPEDPASAEATRRAKPRGQ